MPSPPFLLAKLALSIMGFTGLVYGIALDEAILKDLITPGSNKCIDDGSTTFSYTHTPSPSYWDPNNSYREEKNFLAEMMHSNSDPNKSWTVRFGKGGSIYSMRSGYGEAIPPQTQAFSPWVDEVKQSVAVDLIQNNCAIPSQCYYMHQAGNYFKDTDYLNEPFYSPNVAKHCESNTCIFATWGQIAEVPTIFKSDILYVHQYRGCGNGVLEYTQMFTGYFGGQIAYLNIPWAGVRTSNLPDVYLSNLDNSMAPVVKEANIPLWGADAIKVTLPEMGGYTTFAQDTTQHSDSTAALSYVHGVCNEYSDTENKYFRAPSRLRIGLSGRDYTVFTVNGRLTSKSGDTFVHRQFLINDSLGNITDRAKDLYDEAYGLMLRPSDFSGRHVEVYTLNLGTFGVVAASDEGGTSTTCVKDTIVLDAISTGDTTPSSIDKLPFFSIKCGSLSYFGPDKYHFAPDPDQNGMIRSYVCKGQAKGVVPEWKLLGFYPQSDDFSTVENAAYDPSFCDEPPTISPTTNPTDFPTSSPTTSPTISPTTSPTEKGTTASPTINPTSSPTTSPTLSPTSSPTKSPTSSPTTNPTDSPTSSPTTRPTIFPTTSPTEKGTTASPTINPTSSPTTNPTLPKLCSSYKSFTRCEAAGCVWDKESNGCLKPKPCPIYNNKRKCKNNDCYWDNIIKICSNTKPCSAYNSTKRCVAANCLWKSRTCSTPKPCSKHKKKKICNKFTCFWDSELKVCSATSLCVLYTEGQRCKTNDCFWNANLKKCYDTKPCWMYDKEKSCEKNDCTWKKKSKKCI